MRWGSLPLKTSDSRTSASLCFVTSDDHRRVFDGLFGVLLIDSFARRRSIADAHAGCVNKFFRMMINLTSGTPAIFVNVHRASLHAGDRRWWQVDFVFHRLTMIRELQLRMIDAVEFPKHSNEIGLTTK